MIEKKKKKSKAIIISIIVMAILGLSIFLIFKNKEKLFPTESDGSNFFQSLFGVSTSKKSNIGSVMNVSAREDIKRGDILKLDGRDEKGNPVVSKITNIDNYSDIYGIAIEDISQGKIGKILRVEKIEKIEAKGSGNIKKGDLLKITQYDNINNPVLAKIDNLKNYSDIYGIAYSDPTPNGENFFPLEILRINYDDTGAFKPLFGTSAQKRVEIINDIISNKNPTKISVQAGENIKKGDILKIVGYNSNGDPIVVKIEDFEIDDYTDIFGVATGDLDIGEIGEIVIPDLSQYENIFDKIGNIYEQIKDWINNIVNNFTSNTENITNPEVTIPTPEDFPQIKATATPNQIDKGGTSIIEWESTNTTACDIGDGYIENTSGNFTTEPLTTNTSFVVSCKNGTNYISATVFVYVKSDTTNNFPRVTLTAKPQRINPGETSVISWESTNSTSCDLGNGYTEDTSGYFTTKPLTTNSLFSVKCKNETGSATSANVFVQIASNLLLPSVTVKAEPNNIEKNGYSTISWVATNATKCVRNDLNLSCTKNGLKTNCKNIDTTDVESKYECKNNGNTINCSDIKNLIEVETDDGFVVGPLTESKSYSITCSNEYGSASGNAYVFVDNQIEIIFPKISITATPSSIKYGESSLLKWTTENATSCKINNYKQDSAFGFECTKDGAVEPCKDIVDLECKKDGKIVDCNTVHNIECKKNGNTIDCENLYNIETNDSMLLKNLTQSGIFSISCQGEKGSMSGSAFVFVEQRGQCEDGIDNDKDGGADREDISCYKNFDKKEENFVPSYWESRVDFVPECMDTLDNEALASGTPDGADAEDPDCYDLDGKYNPNIWFEYSILPRSGKNPACSDGIDNDKDGKIDQDDPQCHADGDVNNADSWIKEHYSENIEISYLPQCSDFKDNDGDGLKDKEDPSCYDDFDVNGQYYNALLRNEARTAPIVDQCEILDKYALEFTEEQKARMKTLLRQFYLLAPKLKDSDDIENTYREIAQNNGLVEQAKKLTNECYSQSIDRNNIKVSGYNGPTARYGNPWYRPETRTAESTYVSDKTSESYQNYISGQVRSQHAENLERLLIKCAKNITKCEDNADKFPIINYENTSINVDSKVMIYTGRFAWEMLKDDKNKSRDDLIKIVNTNSQSWINGANGAIEKIAGMINADKDTENMYTNFEQIFDIW